MHPPQVSRFQERPGPFRPSVVPSSGTTLYHSYGTEFVLQLWNNAVFKLLIIKAGNRLCLTNYIISWNRLKTRFVKHTALGRGRQKNLPAYSLTR